MTKEEAIEAMCKLAEEASALLEWQHSADCFCGYGERKGIARPTPYSFSPAIVDILRSGLERERKIVRGDRPPPVPMILNCPACKARHVDAGEFADKAHHTHACQECGMVWRPALVDTVGVQFLPGYKNT